MVLGINYLTRAREGAPGEGKWFGSGDEIILAQEAGAVDYQALCKVKIDGEYVETTAGTCNLQ